MHQDFLIKIFKESSKEDNDDTYGPPVISRFMSMVNGKSSITLYLQINGT